MPSAKTGCAEFGMVAGGQLVCAPMAGHGEEGGLGWAGLGHSHSSHKDAEGELCKVHAGQAHSSSWGGGSCRRRLHSCWTSRDSACTSSTSSISAVATASFASALATIASASVTGALSSDPNAPAPATDLIVPSVFPSAFMSAISVVFAEAGDWRADEQEAANDEEQTELHRTTGLHLDGSAVCSCLCAPLT